MGWWGLVNLFPPSKTDEQRSRKKMLERELAEKKLAIKGQSREKLNFLFVSVLMRDFSARSLSMEIDYN